MKTRRAAFALTLLVAAGPASAGDVCYSEDRFPSVVWIDTMENDVRIWLGGMYGVKGWKLGQILIFRKNGFWVQVPASATLEEAQRKASCIGKVPPAPRTKEEESLNAEKEKYDIEVRAEGPFRCVQEDCTVWFGISYYQGEGFYGVGGIGRFDPESRKCEVRRPNLLRNSVVPSVAWDGRNLWVCTHDPFSECIGNLPTEGLVKYNWAADEATVFRDTEEGPCGFVPHAVLWRDGQLWVGTDLGIDRWDSKENRWHHYIPAAEPGPLVRETTCAALYQELLDRLRREVAQSVEWSAQGLFQFQRALLKFHPKTARKLQVVDPEGATPPPE